MRIPMEDWLRGCVYHDGRHGEVTLSTDKVLEIANYIQLTRTSLADGMIELPPYEPKDEPQKIGYCNEFKWFRDKQVWGRCRSKNMYAPKTEPQTDTHDIRTDTHECVKKPKVKKPCAKCEYHDWVWDEHFGYGSVCNGIGKCPYNVEETITSEPKTEPQTERSNDE